MYGLQYNFNELSMKLHVCPMVYNVISMKVQWNCILIYSLQCNFNAISMNLYLTCIDIIQLLEITLELHHAALQFYNTLLMKFQWIYIWPYIIHCNCNVSSMRLHSTLYYTICLLMKFQWHCIQLYIIQGYVDEQSMNLHSKLYYIM